MIKNNLKLGIYLTTYNSGNDLKLFLESIHNFSKKYKIYVVLSIVDNFSKDITKKIIFQFKNKIDANYIDVLFTQRKCSRGLGYQLALSQLLKYTDIEYVMRSDADYYYIPHLLYKYLKQTILYYEPGDVWNGYFMSIETAREIAFKKIYYPNSLVFEDYIWWSKLFKKGFKIKWLMALPPILTKTIKNREKRYVKSGIQYIKRKIKIYLDIIRYIWYNIYNFHSYSFYKIKRNFILLFPEEIGLSKDLLLDFFHIKYLPDKVLNYKKDFGINDILFKRITKKYIIVYRKSTNILISRIQKQFIKWLQGKR